MNFYASDFLGDDRVCELDGWDQGLYALLLLHEWQAKGRGLPSGHETLARMLRISLDDFEAAWTRGLCQFFKLLEAGSEHAPRLKNARCEEEISRALKKARKASKKAREAAKARYVVGEGAAPSTAPSMLQAGHRADGDGDGDVFGSSSESSSEPKHPEKTTRPPREAQEKALDSKLSRDAREETTTKATTAVLEATEKADSRLAKLREALIREARDPKPIEIKPRASQGPSLTCRDFGTSALSIAELEAYQAQTEDIYEDRSKLAKDVARALECSPAKARSMLKGWRLPLEVTLEAWRQFKAREGSIRAVTCAQSFGHPDEVPAVALPPTIGELRFRRKLEEVDRMDREAEERKQLQG